VQPGRSSGAPHTRSGQPAAPNSSARLRSLCTRTLRSHRGRFPEHPSLARTVSSHSQPPPPGGQPSPPLPLSTGSPGPAFSRPLSRTLTQIPHTLLMHTPPDTILRCPAGHTLGPPPSPTTELPAPRSQNTKTPSTAHRPLGDSPGLRPPQGTRPPRPTGAHPAPAQLGHTRYPPRPASQQLLGWGQNSPPRDPQRPSLFKVVSVRARVCASACGSQQHAGARGLRMHPLSLSSSVPLSLCPSRSFQPPGSGMSTLPPPAGYLVLESHAGARAVGDRRWNGTRSEIRGLLAPRPGAADTRRAASPWTASILCAPRAGSHSWSG
jgi:hypothetical protein